MVLLLDVERIPLDVWDDEKDRDIGHRKINLNEHFHDIGIRHRISAARVRQRFGRFCRNVEWAFLKNTIDADRYVHPALIEMYLLFDRRPYEFWDATEQMFFTPDEQQILLKSVCEKVGMAPKQWYYVKRIVARAVSALERRREAEALKTMPLAVWDRFTASHQEWTPEAQYREFNEMTGDIE